MLHKLFFLSGFSNILTFILSFVRSGTFLLELYRLYKHNPLLLILNEHNIIYKTKTLNLIQLISVHIETCNTNRAWNLLFYNGLKLFDLLPVDLKKCINLKQFRKLVNVYLIKKL